MVIDDKPPPNPWIKIVGDLDGGASDESVAAATDGWIYVLASDGSLRWKRDLGAPVNQAAVAKLDGRSPTVLASGVSREVVALADPGCRTRKRWILRSRNGRGTRSQLLVSQPGL